MMARVRYLDGNIVFRQYTYSRVGVRLFIFENNLRISFFCNSDVKIKRLKGATFIPGGMSEC